MLHQKMFNLQSETCLELLWLTLLFNRKQDFSQCDLVFAQGGVVATLLPTKKLVTMEAVSFAAESCCVVRPSTFASQQVIDPRN
jgi:hypothetical protein